MGLLRINSCILLAALATSVFQVDGAGDQTCTGISKEVSCDKCDETTHKCLPGKVPVDPWIVATAKTQRELQIDEQWNKLQMLDAHNGYNSRAFGFGLDDNCSWPPPTNPTNCNNYANQEFSFTDLLNMGIRALEIDNWFCAGEMRMAHLGNTIDLECNSKDPLFSAGIKQIGDWIKTPGNEEEMVRVYLNEKYNQYNDSKVNGPLEQHLGDHMLTPKELKDSYGGKWPTVREMKKAGKSVVVASGGTAGTGIPYTHGGVYIHEIYWEDKEVKDFTNYPQCGGKNLSNAIRFYSDSTYYANSTYVRHDGPNKGTGVIFDFAEYVKCRIQYPATDMITPDLIKTAFFTWAEGQPNTVLTKDSCIYIKKDDWRWYLAGDCSMKMNYACQNETNLDDWKISSATAAYDPASSTVCPTGYKFSVPQDGFRHQKLKEAAAGKSVWINYSPWLPVPVPSGAPSVGRFASFTVLLFCLLSSFAY